MELWLAAHCTGFGASLGTMINNCDVYGTLMELEQHIAQALEPVSDWDKGTNTDIGRDQNQH